MKLSATQANLQKGLSLVSRVVGNAATLPVLANILMETEKGRLRLTATDLEIGVSTWVGAKVETDGAVTVPARTIVDFVAANTDEAINLSSAKDTLTALSPSFKAEIPGINPTEYPSVPVIEQGTSVTLSRQDILNALKSVMIAAAIDEARPALAGVLLKGNATKQLSVAATDSFRLAEYTIDLEQEVAGLEIIIPARAVHEVVRILGLLTEVGAVTIIASNNQVYFKMGDTDLVTRLIEASYPDYKKVIPTSFISEVVVAGEEIANALRMASIFTTNQANNVHVKIDSQEVRLTSAASQYGQEVTALTAEVMHHTEEKVFDIAFNTRYLLDAVNVAGGSKLILKFSGSTSPAVVVNPDIPKYQHIVMPIRVNA